MANDEVDSGKSDNPFERLRERIGTICRGDEDDSMEQKTRLHEMGETLSEVVTALEAQAQFLAGLRAEMEQVQQRTTTLGDRLATLGAERPGLGAALQDSKEAEARKALQDRLLSSLRVSPSTGQLPQGTLPSVSNEPETAFLIAKKKAGAPKKGR